MKPVSKLERFRRYVAEMDPTLSLSSRAAALVTGDPRDSLLDSMCTGLELSPTQRVLLLGCTGSGKTTLLRRCLARLRQTLKDSGDIALFVDVGKKHRLDDASLQGVLVAIAGEFLIQKAETVGDLKKDKEFQEAKKRLEQHARDYQEWVEYNNDEDPHWEDQDHDYEPPDGYYATRRGVLKPPVDHLVPRYLSEYVEPLRILRDRAVPGEGAALVAFDSLDRLADASRFKDAVADDLPALASAGIGTVVVGPVRYSLGTDRTTHNLFDSVKVMPTIDERTPEGARFLAEVLTARDRTTLLSTDAVSSIVESSGGVLRDLISIARRAGEEAYAKGHDPITASDVAVATSALGESLAFGIDDNGVAVLKKLADSGEFVIRGEAELALVDQRLILNVGTGKWRIHPALVPKLQGIPG